VRNEGWRMKVGGLKKNTTNTTNVINATKECQKSKIK
jgi:hypothetical protein